MYFIKPNTLIRSINISKTIVFRQCSNNTYTKSKKNIHPIKLFLGVGFGGLCAYDGFVNHFAYLGATERFVRSLKIATQISFDYYWNLKDIAEGTEDYERIIKDVHMKSADRLLKGCLANGGLYVKLGQGVSALNHILPVEYTRTLSKLLDECLPSHESDVRDLIIEDFGHPPELIFREFDYKPIAAASLAQVFKAKLKTGETVAVKVQYADLQKRFPSDIGTIIFLQDVVELIHKNYNFGWIFRELRKNLEQELNFINEGKNAERCADDLSKFKFVYIPKVYWEWTTKRVLTTEWVDGFKITDNARIEKEKMSKYEIDYKLFTIFSEQIFNTGFVHADPHPANVFLRKNRSGNVELVLLDHGLYEYMPKNIRIPLCKFWEAAILKNERAMKHAARLLDIKDHEKFAEVLFQVPYKIRQKRFKTKLTEEDIDYFQKLAKKNFDRVMGTLREMPTNMLFVVRNLNTVRAIGREHGDPLDRGKLMARYAQKCIYTNQNRFLSTFKWIFRRIHFEYCLMKTSLQFFMISFYLDLLHKLGRSPEGSTVLHQNWDEEDSTII